MEAKAGSKILTSLLKTIEIIFREAKLQENGLEFNIDYNNLENSNVSEEASLVLVQSLIQRLQKLQAQYKDDVMPTPPLEEMHADQEDVDWSLVQVKADTSEIDRRIAAFIQQKQNEVDLVNRREFCNILDTSENNVSTCARTDAIFVPRFGQKSHIKVTRVGNTSTSDEAQALGNVTDMTRQSGRPKMLCTESSVTERLHDIEQHLGFTPGGPVAHDIYEALQRLENRILFLESLSLEYFDHNVCHLKGSTLGKQVTGSSSLESLSLSAIDERIVALKNSLQNQAR